MVKMADLKTVFEDLGFTNVQTILNSGNVIFETIDTNISLLTKKIIGSLFKKFGREIGVIVRTAEEIHQLVKSDPFKNIKVPPATRLYVTFLAEPPTSTLPIPYQSPEKDFQILRLTNSEVYSVITISTQKNTTDLMKVMDKEFGRKVTTRNWNTVLKCVDTLPRL